MVADAPVPLATTTQLAEGHLADLVAGYSTPALADLMVEATRACEGFCNRRLAPFTGLVESHRLEGVDPEELSGVGDVPMDLQGTLGSSYAGALDSIGNMVRHLWLREYAPMYPDLWSYSGVQVGITRSLGGSQTLNAGNITGPDPGTGHVWLQLGLFAPVGSWAQVTYSGGYNPVPADLVRACKLMAGSIAATELDPMDVRRSTVDELRAQAEAILLAYDRT